MTEKRKPAGKSVPKSGKFCEGVIGGWPDIPPAHLIADYHFQKAPRGTNAVRGESDTIDWFTTFRYPIGGETYSAEDGLRRRREAIEEIVAPHISAQKSKHAIRFKGEQRYVQTIENENMRYKVWYAIEVLQGIYNIQDAWRESDINDAIRIAYCVGRLDVFLETSERFDAPLNADVIQYYLAKERGESKKGKTKLKGVPKMVLETAYAKCKHLRFKKDQLEAIRDELKRQGFPLVSPVTIGRRLEELGIVDK